MNGTELYRYYMIELADPRTNDWYIIQSILPVSSLTIAYLYFVYYLGPSYMEKRKPYSFSTFIKCYNVFQIITNYLIVYHVLEAGWYRDYFIYCRKPDFSYNYGPYKIATVSKYVLLLKLIDYVETILFVLRKKQQQVSFLHVYHHVSTAVITWVLTKYIPTGMVMSHVLLNCCIHVIMYTYYLLSSFGPKFQKFLNPIKPMITISQMIQFVLLILYDLSILVYPGCPGEEIGATILIVDLSINFFLFYQFYQRSYKKKSKTT